MIKRKMKSFKLQNVNNDPITSKKKKTRIKSKYIFYKQKIRKQA